MTGLGNQQQYLGFKKKNNNKKNPLDTGLRVTMGSHFIQKCYVTSQNPLVYIRHVFL